MSDIDVTQLRADLKRDEGTVLHCYKDSKGLDTIGTGILIDARGGGISEYEADFLLDNRITRLIGNMDAKLPWLLTKSDGVQRALANMAFNLGLSGLLEFKDMLAKIQSGDYVGASEAALDSAWAKQVGDRALRIASLIKMG